MITRDQQRLAFATRAIGREPASIDRASEDASFRSYWRVLADGERWILMDAPPQHEDCRPFVAVAERLRNAGLRPPEIHAADLELGFLLLEDLGDTLVAELLDEERADEVYRNAFSMLEEMTRVSAAGLPEYDAERLTADLELFPTWFVGGQLGRPVDAAFLSWWNPLVNAILTSALQQPRVFVHRDFHCGNLMPLGDEYAVLDFQDAVAGPITYDLISLLQDRYIAWPRERLLTWSDAHRRQVAPDVTAETWTRWVDWMGLQRNLKVVGIFARLDQRDGKARYLEWQPRFAHYVRDVAGRYRELGALSAFLDTLPDELIAP